MAEHDSDREDGPEPEEQSVPFDEEAAWAAIIAGYGEEPPDPPGARPFRSVEDLALLEPVTGDGPDGKKAKEAATETATEPQPAPAPEGKTKKDDGNDKGDKTGKPLGGSVSFAPGVGPRDYRAPEPSDDDLGEDDDGHFVPPEPPPLPEADATAKFAWMGVLGGPVLLLLAVLLGWNMTWWLTTLSIGGFLGGSATLVMRMRTDDEDDDDPGRGAVV